MSHALYDIPLQTIAGAPASLAEHAGKVLLIDPWIANPANNADADHRRPSTRRGDSSPREFS